MKIKNAPTKKISIVEHDEILNVYIQNTGINVYVSKVDGGFFGNVYVPDFYQVSSHQGFMPAFHTSKYGNLQELANAMREISDLRKWRVVKDEN